MHNYLNFRFKNCPLKAQSLKYVFFMLFISLNINVYGQVEICNNNRDDDGDGFIDCADPDCGCVANTFPCDSKMYMVRANPADFNATNIEELSISGVSPRRILGCTKFRFCPAAIIRRLKLSAQEQVAPSRYRIIPPILRLMKMG
jgi:hypothetical protein